MRIEYYPDLPQNPYQRLYAAALANHGINHRPARLINDKTLEENRNNLDAIHFHWIEGLIGAGSTLSRLRKIVSLHRYLRHARRLGIKIIWTVHNHARHDDYKTVDQLGNRAMCKSADLIITHSRCSADWLSNRFRPTGKIIVMPHGNFDGCYHPQKSPDLVRSELNLKPDLPLLGMIGAVRPYRGHENAIHAVKRLGSQTQLLIAGWEFNKEYGDQIKTMLQSLPHAAALFAGINDTKYAELVQACDLILLPYEQITSSGAIMSAWTLSRPVVANNVPFFQEILADTPDAGLAAPAHDPNQFAHAIEQMLAVPKSRRQTAARTQADRYSWDKVVLSVAKIIQSWKPGK